MACLHWPMRFENECTKKLIKAGHALLRDSDRMRFCAAQFGQFQKIGKIPCHNKKCAETVV